MLNNESRVEVNEGLKLKVQFLNIAVLHKACPGRSLKQLHFSYKIFEFYMGKAVVSSYVLDMLCGEKGYSKCVPGQE